MNTENTLPIVVTKIGKEKGKTLVVMAGVHGNEKPCVSVVEKLIEGLIVEKGVVHFVVANPPGIRAGVRMVNHNMNRIIRHDFQSDHYEYQSVQKIMEILDSCDAMLDLHAFNDPAGEAFLISSERGFDMCGVLPYDRVISGLPNMSDGSSDGYMEKLGRVGIVAELGCMDNHDECMEKGVATVKKFLGYYGAINIDHLEKKSQQKLEAMTMYMKRNEDFAFTREFHNFELFKAGEYIAHDGGVPISADFDTHVIFPFAGTPVGQEAFFMCKEIG